MLLDLRTRHDSNKHPSAAAVPLGTRHLTPTNKQKLFSLHRSPTCSVDSIKIRMRKPVYVCTKGQEPGNQQYCSRVNNMASSSGYCCPLCEGFVVPTYRLWLSHLRHIHSHDPNFHVTCGINSCPRTFRVFSSLYSHVYRSHRDMLEKRGSAVATDCEEFGHSSVAESASEMSSISGTEGLLVLLLFSCLSSCIEGKSNQNRNDDS